MKPKKLFKVQIKKVGLIERVMNPRDKVRTGLAKLTRGDLKALNEWLDKNGVLAPGDQPHIGSR
jgi:ketosteroid isomerase-like protein